MIIISKHSLKILEIVRVILWMFKLEIKISLDFIKNRIYIVHKIDGSLTLFHITQLKLSNLYTIKSLLVHIYLNFGQNLTFILLLVFVDTHCHLLCEKVSFLFSNIKLR